MASPDRRAEGRLVNGVSRLDSGTVKRWMMESLLFVVKYTAGDTTPAERREKRRGKGMEEGR